MALIVVRLTFRQARSQGQDGSRPIQGLDWTLLIHAQHESSIRRVEVKSHHIAHLLLELRVVGNLKLFHPVRLHVITLPDAVHHHARNPQPAGQRAHAPVGGVGRARLQRGYPGSSAPTLRSGRAETVCASEAGAEPRSRRGRKPHVWPEPSGATARFAEQSSSWKSLGWPAKSPHTCEPPAAGWCRPEPKPPTAASELHRS